MSDWSGTISPHQLRAQIEAMVLGDLLGPAGGDGRRAGAGGRRAREEENN